MAFGPKITIRNPHRNLTLTLRPFYNVDEVKKLAPFLSDIDVLNNLGRLNGLTERQEVKWFEKVDDSKDDVMWAIEMDGEVIGNTGLHHIDYRSQSATSGICIFRPEHWGKGIAGTAHRIRMWYAYSTGIKRIDSHARARNLGSCKALERAGYTHVDSIYYDEFRGGEWLTTNHYRWYNPRQGLVLPERYQLGLERAERTIREADEWIVHIK
jgi:RimJ/RimL family protein N-acetyltransferase